MNQLIQIQMSNFQLRLKNIHQYKGCTLLDMRDKIEKRSNNAQMMNTNNNFNTNTYQTPNHVIPLQ